jgi:general secretion pathway protein K
MAIVYVLWGIGLLSSIAVSLLSAGNVATHLSRQGLDIAQADAAAEAALSRAVLALLDRRPERRWRVDGVPQDFTFAGVTMRIAIQDELGRIDINHADRSPLVGLFRSAGLGAQAADSLVDKILDWRDASPARRLNGAKDQEYAAAGLAYKPRNGPFQSVDELKLVMDMTSELFERVAPALTVYSGRQFLDRQFAPREALLALPGMTASAVSALIAGRTNDSSERARLQHSHRVHRCWPPGRARGRGPADGPSPPTLLAAELENEMNAWARRREAGRRESMSFRAGQRMMVVSP